ncbi:hypothetical protein [Crateriforma spongiae]|nr:hypothetical protein [Crateriforma spongiae]
MEVSSVLHGKDRIMFIHSGQNPVRPQHNDPLRCSVGSAFKKAARLA